ncbi:hypothetical protein GCM10027569_49910 [Flindersiella endophytica]
MRSPSDDAADPLACAGCGRLPGSGADPVLRCPGCEADSGLAARAIAAMVVRLGTQARACDACERITIVVEPSMVCAVCVRPLEEVNDLLYSRYATTGPADPADAPCVGCGYYVSRPNPGGPALDVLIECQGCGDQIRIPEEDFAVGQGIRLLCGRCHSHTLVPKTVWCPKCGQHLRTLGIPELVREANRDNS